ncbi:hypothetical protein T4D_7137, partial [Trichinella pseudospiralis]
LNRRMMLMALLHPAWTEVWFSLRAWRREVCGGSLVLIVG